MYATLLDGKAVATATKEALGSRIAALAERGVTPGLATILVGDDPASEVYVASKRRTATSLGIVDVHHHLSADVTQDQLDGLIEQLNDDPAVHGILLQLPLPEGLDGEEAVRRIDPAKDADGLHPENLGRLILDQPGPTPCTPTGVLRILDHYEVPTEGRRVVVVGRSFLVGRPISVMLSSKARNATVTLAHSRTEDLPALCREADIIIAAVGQPQLIGLDWVSDGATVIDVGINRTDDGLVGDVDFAVVSERAGAITPVPGGVGPMTIAMLMENTVALAEASAYVAARRRA